MITPVPSTHVDDVWECVRDHIDRAITQVDTGFCLDDVLEKLRESDMQLWVVNQFDAAVVTQIQVYPQHKVLLFVAVGGSNMAEWLDEMLDVIEEWGRQMGCRYAEAFGRAGWERAVKHRDFHKVYTVVRKDLSNGQG
jgi:hypothetical protein